MALDRLSQITNSGISTTISFRSAGINVSGVVTASSFVGDGSGLTGVVGSGSGITIKDDNSTVGTAGTINFGSNLSVSAISSGIVTVTGTDTNTTYTQAAVASGANVNIRLTDSDATTDDILLTAGSNVTFSSVTAAGFTINSSGSGGSSQFAETSIGIHTLSNVGIGTTNPTSKLTVTGDANITGVVTATSFSGDGSALTGITASQTPSFTTLNVVGVSTFAGITTVTGTTLFAKQLNVSGVVTAASFSGDGSALTGITASQTPSFTTLNVVGVSTFAGITTVTGTTLFAKQLNVSGVVTATTFVGALTGTASNVTTNANLTGDVTSSGNATSIAAGVIVDADINASAAISLSKLATTGTLTATTFVGTAATTFYISEWILGANGSDDYTFTGPGLIGAENDPVLYLVRGQQYKFTNTMGAHPFRIQSIVNGSTGTQYNDGITNNDVSNGTLTWDVQFDAPNLLYYQCTAHSGMGGKIYILNSEDNVSAGTTSAPSISPSGDSNTGIFFPSADTIAFAEGGAEAMRIDSSSRLLVGTSTARANFLNAGLSSKLQIEGTTGTDSWLSVVGNNNSAGGEPILLFGKSRGATTGSNTVVQSGDILGQIIFQGADGTDFVQAASIGAYSDATPDADDMPGRIVLATTADGASSPTERMRIASDGDIWMNSSNGSSGTQGIVANSTGLLTVCTTNTAAQIINVNSGSSTRTLITFRTDGTDRGSITSNGTTTAYNTTSDYRLKENVVPLTGAADRLNQLQVRRFNFIADPDTTVDGFLAHEAQAIVPECVTGAKDEVDADGNPVYQGIDQSKLVPLLTAALQEAIGEIEST
jgi:hypothetical protein